MGCVTVPSFSAGGGGGYGCITVPSFSAGGGGGCSSIPSFSAASSRSPLEPPSLSFVSHVGHSELLVTCPH